MVLKHLKAAWFAPAPLPIVPVVWRQPLAPVFLAAAFVAWFFFTSTEQKVRCVLGAASFSVIEFSFRSMTYKLPDGKTVFAPWDRKRCRKGHTSVQQFVGNILYVPIVVDGYFYTVKQLAGWIVASGAVSVESYSSIAIVLGGLLWSLNIWLLEIVMGLTMIWMYGFCPAWRYNGSDAFLYGTIKLSYARFWLPMGLVVSLLYSKLFGF